MSRLVLIRGLPGSGKSTLAKAMVGYEHFEADMFHVGADGVYRFNPEVMKDAHDWCFNACFGAIGAGRHVVVSNTFTTYQELGRYTEEAHLQHIPYAVIVARGNFQNVHNVPDEVLAKMRARWQD